MELIQPQPFDPTFDTPPDEQPFATYRDAAPLYLKAGWSPLPLGAREKTAPPTGYTGRGGAYATAEEVALWSVSFPRWNKELRQSEAIPSVNLAVRMPATVVGIDVDHYGAKRGNDGIVALEERLGKLPPTWASTSRGPGDSGIWFYRVPAGTELPGKPCADVEFIQRHHRYAVVWPSIHPEGRAYEWYRPDGELAHRVPRLEELADLPAAWLAHDYTAQPEPTAGTRALFSVPTTVFGRGVSAAVERVVNIFRRDAPGGRHDAMVAAVLALIRLRDQGHPGASDALEDLRAEFITSVTTDGTRMLRSQAEAEKEWNDAVAGGERIASTTPSTRPDWDQLDHSRPTKKPGDITDFPPTTEAVELVVPKSWSDAHVGEAFGATLTGRWLYCRTLGGWFRWDGRRWQLDPGEAVHEEFRQWIITLGEMLWKQAGDGDTMKQVARYRDRGKIDAAVTIARRLEAVAANAAEFDQHPHLLNVTNGIVDLRTGTLAPHDPALRMTKIAGATYRPDADHPDLHAVLEALDDDVRQWVQRLFGSAAYGQVVDDVLAVFDGTGSNGKTTLLKAAAHALGEYAAPASTRLLMARGVSDEHPTLLADLKGRRLVYIEETPEGGALKMEQVKSITGGGALKARFIGRDYFEFEPSHQIIVATNHRPAVNASDYAAWRRLRLVPFTRTYRLAHEAQPGDLIADRGLRGRLGLPAQREAMLAWIVAGAVAWHAASGLGGCPTIDTATTAWRRDEDVIHAWWNDRLVAGGSVAAAELYRSFVSWCEQEGRRYISSNKEFAKKLVDHDLYRDHNITKKNTATGAWYFGLSVVDVVGTSLVFSRGSYRETTPPPTTTTTSRHDPSGGVW